MAITYQWTISALEVKPVVDDFENVVVTAHWRCTGTEEQYTGATYAACSFSAPSEDFTPFDQLTEEQVFSWVYASGVDKAAAEASIATQIEQQKNPPVCVVTQFPWSAVTNVDTNITPAV